MWVQTWTRSLCCRFPVAIAKARWALLAVSVDLSYWEFGNKVWNFVYWEDNSGNGAEGSLEKNRRADCWVEDVVIVRRVDRGKFSEWWPRQAGGARRFSKPWRGQSMEIWDLSPFLPSKILLKYFRCENRN